jgi:sugar phosphate isomerase/epimerase
VTRTALQLHTVRKLDESLERKLDRAANAGYAGVQFTPDFDGLQAGAVRDMLDERDLEVAGCHIDLEGLEAEYEDTTAFYRELGCRDLVVSSYDPEAFTSEDGVQRVVDHLSTLADRLEDDGFDLHYHNHLFEFEALGEGTAYDRFFDQTAGVIAPEVDTGLAHCGGADPVELIERYGDRIELIHLTDSIAGSDETLHIDLGDGEVDLQACVDAARTADVDWLIYENGLTDDSPASLTAAADVLSRLLDS